MRRPELAEGWIVIAVVLVAIVTLSISAPYSGAEALQRREPHATVLTLKSRQKLLHKGIAPAIPSGTPQLDGVPRNSMSPHSCVNHSFFRSMKCAWTFPGAVGDVQICAVEICAVDHDCVYVGYGVVAAGMWIRFTRGQ